MLFSSLGKRFPIEHLINREIGQFDRNVNASESSCCTFDDLVMSCFTINSPPYSLSLRPSPTAHRLVPSLYQTPHPQMSHIDCARIVFETQK